MTRSDYIRQVDSLRAPEELRARITALPEGRRRPSKLRRWVPLCACLAIVVAGAGLFGLIRSNGGLGGNAGGGGHEEGSTFMSYAGPVFPLTVLGEPDLSAQRDITLDFSPWEKVWISNEKEAASRTDLTQAEQQEVLDQYNEWFPDGGYYQSSSDILVTDSYTLTNPTDTDQIVTLLYPFASSLDELDETSPTLSADGAALGTALYTGAYSGGFTGTFTGWFGEEGSEPGSVNLDQLDSWEEYAALLSDGSYLAAALGEPPDLTGVPVTVYEFTDPWGEPQDEDAGIPTPSLRATFHLDYERTTVLSYGFHSGHFDRENHFMGRGFSIRQPGEWGNEEQVCYLIVLGEDITDLATQGYVTGGFDTAEEIDAGVTIRRYESDLGTELRQILRLAMDSAWAVDGLAAAQVDFEVYYQALCEHLLAYGVLSEGGGVERYDTGQLEDVISELANVDRVFYLEAEVTVPAGGSVTVEAQMTKQASYDFYCAHTENRGVSGYDLVTRLGSSLDFTGQSARLERGELIEIVRQNFGFDLENGVSSVTLDPEQEHYYLEVRRAAES